MLPTTKIQYSPTQFWDQFPTKNLKNFVSFYIEFHLHKIPKYYLVEFKIFESNNIKFLSVSNSCKYRTPNFRLPLFRSVFSLKKSQNIIPFPDLSNFIKPNFRLISSAFSASHCQTVRWKSLSSQSLKVDRSAVNLSGNVLISCPAPGHLDAIRFKIPVRSHGMLEINLARLFNPGVQRLQLTDQNYGPHYPGRFMHCSSLNYRPKLSQFKYLYT